MQQILLWALAIANVFGLVHLGLFTIGANIYDIQRFRSVRRRAMQGASATRPLVSVVIPAHNEAAVIRRTLESVRRSSYQAVEIIVVDDGSTDGTAAVVRRYIRQLSLRQEPKGIGRPVVRVRKTACPRPGAGRCMRPRTSRDRKTFPINLLRQANSGKAMALNAALRKQVHGELTMCLDADSVLHPRAIERAVAYFKDSKVVGVAANVRILPTWQWLHIVQRFEHLIGYRSKKFYSITSSEFIVGGVASTYRTAMIRSVQLYDADTLTEDIGLSLKLIDRQGNRSHRIVYAADVVALTEGVQNLRQLIRQRYRWKMGSLQNLYKYRRLFGNINVSLYHPFLTMYRLPMAILSECLLLLQPLLFAGVLYLSICYRTWLILIGAYVTITLYVLWSVLFDEHLERREKILGCALAFVMYFLFYVMDVVQLCALYRCARNGPRIIRGEAGRGTWTSPSRLGQTSPF